MDRRWAPAAAAVAVVVLVGAVALVLSRDDDAPGRVATLPAATTEASPTPEPEPEPSASTPPAPTAPPSPSAPPSSSPEATPPQPPPPAPSSAAPAPRRPAPSPVRSASEPPRPAPTTAARATFSFDSAYATDEPNEVVVQYGDSSSCPHSAVTHAVRETAERVVVTLTADAMDPGRACTADYRAMLVPVRLEQPLGDRVLVDGHRNEPVPVDRACSRPSYAPPPPKDCKP